MNPKTSACCWSLLLLVQVAGTRPASDAQSLEQLLGDGLRAPPYGSSEELRVEERDGSTDKSAFGAPEPRGWVAADRSNSALDAKGGALARLVKDLVRTSRRSWSRYKKGGLRSCFGVRLDRIGSFSGLGC